MVKEISLPPPGGGSKKARMWHGSTVVTLSGNLRTQLSRLKQDTSSEGGPLKYQVALDHEITNVFCEKKEEKNLLSILSVSGESDGK